MAASGQAARRVRRASPIHVYVGPNGSGKSLCMVYDTLPSLEAGRPVLSTTPLFDFGVGWMGAVPAGVELLPDQRVDDKGRVVHPLYLPLRHVVELLDAEHCDVLADEVTGVASSRDSKDMPRQMANLLVQLRRRDIALRVTAPSWNRADVIIRETAQAATRCRGWVRQAVALYPDGRWVVGKEARRAAAEDASLSMWQSRSLFRFRTFDAQDFDDLQQMKTEKARPLAAQWFWARGHDVQGAYDSLGRVDSLNGHLDDFGTCLDCGGTRKRHACDCGEDRGARRGTAAALRERREAFARARGVNGGGPGPAGQPESDNGCSPDVDVDEAA